MNIQQVQRMEQRNVQQARDACGLFYKLQPFHHTKPNPNRKVVLGRKAFVWFGSFQNYEARLANRWPVRWFFVSVARSIRLFFKRAPYRIRRAFATNVDHRETAFFTQLLCLMEMPKDKFDLHKQLGAYGVTTLDKIHVIENAFQYIPALRAINKAIRRLERGLEPKPGYGNVDIFKYPESHELNYKVELRKQLCKEIDAAIAILASLERRT